MRRLEEVFAASKGGAPAGFEDLINYWHSAWGLSGAARRDLHLLRVWRNASDHHDAGEWQRKGPRSAEEALTVLERVERAAGALERRVDLDIYEFRPRDCIEMLPLLNTFTLFEFPSHQIRIAAYRARVAAIANPQSSQTKFPFSSEWNRHKVPWAKPDVGRGTR
eukprot:scaffold2376_cov79-Phaeocystis_antarctica.AAC.5